MMPSIQLPHSCLLTLVSKHLICTLPSMTKMCIGTPSCTHSFTALNTLKNLTILYLQYITQVLQKCIRKRTKTVHSINNLTSNYYGHGFVWTRVSVSNRQLDCALHCWGPNARSVGGRVQDRNENKAHLGNTSQIGLWQTKSCQINWLQSFPTERWSTCSVLHVRMI